ncbi:hypothetical protein ACFOYY_32750 [Streptosporangium jomthongense]|uniref:Uncharacterized protein n=1 Tax=Streptosporangium jomthongense TaxID=1193683 RepID=A0ABV8FAL3_9ACTN
MHDNPTGRLVRRTWAELPRPVAGDLVRPADGGGLFGLVTFGWAEELISQDPAWWRELATAALATAHALEAEQSPMPPAEEPATPVEEEPLGLRAAAVGHPPYIDPTPTGVHPVLNPGADQ